MATITASLMRRCILQMQDAADAEGFGYPDEYHALVSVYHYEVDPSWMPQGYGPRSLRDPSLPLPPVDMSNLPMLDAQPGSLFNALSKIGKRASG